MRRRNVANLPPSTAEGKAAKGGTMLDQLQVTLNPTGELPVLCCSAVTGDISGFPQLPAETSYQFDMYIDWSLYFLERLEE